MPVVWCCFICYTKLPTALGSSNVNYVCSCIPKNYYQFYSCKSTSIFVTYYSNVLVIVTWDLQRVWCK